MTRPEYYEIINEICGELNLQFSLIQKDWLNLGFVYVNKKKLSRQDYKAEIFSRFQESLISKESVQSLTRKYFDVYVVLIARNFDGIRCESIDDFKPEYREKVEIFWEGCKNMSILNFKGFVAKEMLLNKLRRDARRN